MGRGVRKVTSGLPAPAAQRQPGGTSGDARCKWLHCDGRFNHVAPTGRSRRRGHARARGVARRDRTADGNDVPLARRALGPRAAAARRCAATPAAMYPPAIYIERFPISDLNKQPDNTNTPQ